MDTWSAGGRLLELSCTRYYSAPRLPVVPFSRSSLVLSIAPLLLALCLLVVLLRVQSQLGLTTISAKCLFSLVLSPNGDLCTNLRAEKDINCDDLNTFTYNMFNGEDVCAGSAVFLMFFRPVARFFVAALPLLRHSSATSPTHHRHICPLRQRAANVLRAYPQHAFTRRCRSCRRCRAAGTRRLCCHRIHWSATHAAATSKLSALVCFLALTCSAVLSTCFCAGGGHATRSKTAPRDQPAEGPKLSKAEAARREQALEEPDRMWSTRGWSINPCAHPANVVELLGMAQALKADKKTSWMGLNGGSVQLDLYAYNKRRPGEPLVDEACQILIKDARAALELNTKKPLGRVAAMKLLALAPGDGPQAIHYDTANVRQAPHRHSSLTFLHDTAGTLVPWRSKPLRWSCARQSS